MSPLSVLDARCSLVVHYSASAPRAISVRDHIDALPAYSTHRVHMLNLVGGRIPQYLADQTFTTIVFHTTFLARRWEQAAFRKLMPLAEVFRSMGALRAALPQDEFMNVDLLDEWFERAGVDLVFTILSAADRATAYPRAVERSVQFEPTLTGYLSDRFVRRAQSSPRRRSIDIGYRAWRAAAWLGRHGSLKVDIAEKTLATAPKDFKLDVSVRAEDQLPGDRWVAFLQDCRYVLGVEGGASILDRDGSVRARTEAYVAANPSADFSEIEQNCFPGRDDELRLSALSPRHLEACATRTGQILVEGDYGGLLRPGVDYIPVKPDLSNLAEALETARDEEMRLAMTERAYSHVVASGAASYRGFASAFDAAVETALADCDPSVVASMRPSPRAMARLGLHMRVQWAAIIVVWRGIITIIAIARLFGVQLTKNGLVARLLKIRRWVAG